MWQTHSNAFLTRQYQLYYSIKVNKEYYYIAGNVVCKHSTPVARFFPSDINYKDVQFPVSPERPSDRLRRISPLWFAGDGRSAGAAGAAGGGMSFNLLFLLQKKKKKKDKIQLRDILLQSQLRYAVDKISALHKYGEHSRDETQD